MRNATGSGVAMRVRLAKERHPEHYCPRCLWRTETIKGFMPCPKHMKRVTHMKPDDAPIATKDDVDASDIPSPAERTRAEYD